MTLVLKGYAQKLRSNFDVIISWAVRCITFRIVLVIAVVMDLELEQMNVKTILLHGDLEKKIYIS